MASDEDKKKAQELVDEASELLKRSEAEPENKTQIAQQVVALMNKAIALDEENDGAWNHRGLAKAYLDEHQNAINDLDEAIKFNPKNDMAWNNRGFAKYHLGQYEEAIKDFNEALRLNPDDKTIQKNRFAAGIALSSTASTTSASEKRRGIIKLLKLTILEQKIRRFFNRLIQLFLLAFLFAIIVLFFLLIFGFTECLGWSLCFSDNNIIKILGGHSDTANPLSILPIFSILGFIIMPIIWGLSITGQAIMQSSILEQDYFGRLNVMNSLEYYKSDLDDNNRNDLIIAYMESWMNDNTADRMERLYYKKSDAGKTPHEDMMKLCREEMAKLRGDILAKCTNITGTTNPNSTKTGTT